MTYVVVDPFVDVVDLFLKPHAFNRRRKNVTIGKEEHTKDEVEADGEFEEEQDEVDGRCTPVLRGLVET